MLLKSPMFKIGAPIRFSRRELQGPLLNPHARPGKVFFASKVRGHPAQISAGSKQERRKDRWPHHDVCDGKAPSTWLAGHSAHMKNEADDSIGQGYQADPPQDGTRT